MDKHTTIDRELFKLWNHIYRHGIRKGDRTGVGTTSINGYQLRLPVVDGIINASRLRQTPLKGGLVELEGFLKGITDKKFYQDNGCVFWNEWCTSESIPDNLTDEERKAFMRTDRDLGPLGYARGAVAFGGKYNGYDTPSVGGINQLERVINILVKDPTSRRMVVSYWDVENLDVMALEPCHMQWQLISAGQDNDGNEKVDLHLYMRSSDTVLGLPINVEYYSMLLKLITIIATNKSDKTFITNELIVSFGDTHIYNNHLDQLEQLGVFDPLKGESIITECEELGPITYELSKDVELMKSLSDFNHSYITFGKRKTVYGKLNFPVAV